MRTTIRFTDQLLRDAKATAALRGQSLNGFIEEAVRAALADAAKPPAYGQAPPNRLVREAAPAWNSAPGVEDASAPGDRLRRVLEREIWPAVPPHRLGTSMTKHEREALLGYGELGV
jgi:hypothetical protein